VKKIYKYITIASSGQYENKPLYEVTDNRGSDVLGYVFYYKPWKGYCFGVVDDRSVFNNTCLRGIIDFIENHAGKEDS